MSHGLIRTTRTGVHVENGDESGNNQGKRRVVSSVGQKLNDYPHAPKKQIKVLRLKCGQDTLVLEGKVKGQPFK